METRKLTMGQAIVQFLQQQYVERDGQENQFFAGMFGIFGHGNVAGIGQALHQYTDTFRFYQTRNEQSMVHTAAAFAKMSNRLRTFACTTSIGPGATNMITGAAGATINRLPVPLITGRHLFHPFSRPSFTAAGIPKFARLFGERLFQTDFTLLGPH